MSAGIGEPEPLPDGRGALDDVIDIVVIEMRGESPLHLLNNCGQS